MSNQGNCSIAICVDVDRDYPIPIEGKKEAVSGAEHQKEGSPNQKVNTRGTIAGLHRILPLFKDYGIQGTFFLEATTSLSIPESTRQHLDQHEIGCHGLDHEDLTGEDTNVELDEWTLRTILRQAHTMISNNYKTPVGFRAPYTHINKHVFKILHDMGYLYDSSVNHKGDTLPEPYPIYEDLLEVPLPVTKDHAGRTIHLYLWQLFEKGRKIKDYKSAIKTLAETSEGLILISFHSWHLHYFIAEKRYFTPQEVEENVNLLTQILDYLQELNLPILTIADYLEKKGKKDT
ncbi:MAG: polysaccharide deacetylase family protein [Candidatus Ranarchaeia archaeon]|jgi:peptidoglycan/xylan/chitin deacetylase (PgdA/CDA1 family)